MRFIGARSLGFVAVVAATLMGVGCTAGTTYGPGGEPGPYTGPPPETAVWFAGDSLAHHTARHMPHEPFWLTATGASGFVDHAALFNGRIRDNVINAGVETHLPDVVIAMGGVNDLSVGTTAAAIITAMDEFDAELASLGVPVRWVLEPTWGHAVNYQPIYDHLIATYPDVIDCRGQAGDSFDGLHPLDYQWFAYCVDDSVHP
ncbi:MAG: hypothetical protein GY812_08740 [Actinomycetia bacterium]|nr:hypothetical protein [Actinomycetes bacterium]